jgi:hypothetical protein
MNEILHGKKSIEDVVTAVSNIHKSEILREER